MQALLFLSLIILVFFLIRFALDTIVTLREKQKRLSSEDKPDQQTHPMVRCAHCGIHLPQSEAYYDGQHTYCSEGHMRLGPKVQHETTVNHSPKA